MDYPEFMRASMKYTSLHWNDDECGVCGGSGLHAKFCCNGFECGCQGMPVDFEQCECGATQPTDEQLSSI